MIDIAKITRKGDVPQLIDFKKDEVIFKDGEPSNGRMYILSRGQVDVYKNFGEQGEICVATLTIGDFFGEMSLFLDKGRTATIVAKEDVSVYSLNRADILGFLERQPEIAFTFIQSLCMRLDSTNLSALDNRIKYEQDMTMLTAEKSELENTANTDQLTGVYNRRYFIDNVGSLIDIIGRNRYSFLVMLDLDHFKKINDNYGHLAGDHVLVTVAETVTSVVRSSDLFARYGGEEFILYLSCASPDDAVPLVERIREDISNAEFRYNGEQIAVTISAGIAPVSSAREIDSAIARADQALYTAKNEGRNRTVLYSPE